MRTVPIVTLIVAGLCGCIFLALATVRGEPSWDVLAQVGYLPPPRIWDGAYWALVSSAFVHLAVWHLVFNLYWLWTLGSVMERVVGSAKYLVFVVGAAAVTSAAQLGVSGVTGHGASGVVYAIFGFMWASRSAVPEFATVVTEQIATLFWMWLVGCIVATWLGLVNIGNAAHVSGAMLGAAAAQSLMVRTGRRGLAMAATLVIAAASFGSVFWSPWSARWVAYKAYKAHVAGDWDVAIASYRRSIKLGFDRDWALKNLAYAYYSKHDDKEFAATLDELRVRNPREAARVESEIQHDSR
jgi:membrane associated rhomboid family serine protease